MKFLDAVSKTILPAKLREAVSPEIPMDDIDSDSYLYRPLGQNPRDMDENKLTRQNNIAYWMYLTNPYAKRAVDIQIDAIVGDGVTLTATAKDEKARQITQSALDEIWTGDPWNFEQKIDQYLLPLHLFGELALPFSVQDRGNLVFAYIDPSKIDSVFLDENNALRTDYIKLKNQEKKWYVVSNSEQKLKNNEGVFLFQINKLINASRGNGVLLPVIDLLSMLDEALFSEVERMMHLKSFLWDVGIDGNDGDVKVYRDEIEKNPPKPGSVRVHNDKITWNAVTPDIKAADTSHLFKLIYNAVAVGESVPEHWLGAIGFDINAATAKEMNDPSIKHLVRRQGFVRGSFELIIDYALNQMKGNLETEHGKLQAGTDTSYVLEFPEISPKQLGELADTLVKLSQSLTMAVNNKWVSNHGASKVFTGFMESDMGQELPEDDDKQIEAEKGSEEKEVVDLYEKHAKTTTAQP